MSADRHFLAEILERPADDFPRLVYADWLEENGQPDRAAFIRCQVELAQEKYNERAMEGGCLCDRCQRGKELRRRERAALERCGAQVVSPARFAWVQHDSITCTAHLDKSPQAIYSTEFVPRRGFVAEIRLPCAAFLKHGPRLAAAHPLEKVVLTDRRPVGPQGGHYHWLFDDVLCHNPAAHACLPFSWRADGYYLTRETAQAALSGACLLWAADEAKARGLWPS